jgi:arylsulfatase
MPQWELFDVLADPGQTMNIAASHPEVVRELAQAYDRWWVSVQGYLVNEDAVGPDENPFKTLYRKQFGTTQP